MSYCRWSSDFGECDVYVYESTDGFAIHVASRRRGSVVPDHIKNMPCETAAQYIAQQNAAKDWLRKNPSECEYIDLTLISEYAGEDFCIEDPGDAAEQLKLIKESGLNVPQYAIDALLSEVDT